MRTILVSILALVAAAALAVHWLVPPHVERSRNPVVGTEVPRPTEAARRIHAGAIVVDLHADPLLWDRNLLERADYGHVDLPRLRAGNVGVQVFGLVTQSPEGQNVQANSAETDRITPLVLAQAWPPRTWFSYLERALYQSRRLARLAERSNGRVSVIRDRGDLDRLLERRAGGENVVGGLLGLEGAHALEGDPANLDRLQNAGVRMIGLAHFIDNELAGSAHGIDKHGLTPGGRRLVRAAVDRGMVLDLAHASVPTIDDVLALTDVPVVVSHAGVRATCDTPRNLSDDQLRAIAESGGVIGVGLFELATCGTDLDATVAAMRHVANIVGVEHIALGTDFNGGVATPVDAAGLPRLTQALTTAGFSEHDIHAILGGNALRVLRRVLPADEGNADN